jgi:hypothetical protein
MYACLRDDSSLVRSNTLTVLTHLILNDMIKVYNGLVNSQSIKIRVGRLRTALRVRKSLS